jgi:LmeA-like phospholipid-binding
MKRCEHHRKNNSNQRIRQTIKILLYSITRFKRRSLSVSLRNLNKDPVSKAPKRIILLLALTLLVKVDAGCAQTALKKNAFVAGTPKDNSAEALPYRIGSPLSRTIQAVTGLTLLTQFVLDQSIQTAIHHKFGGKVRAKVKLWSLTDLIAGKIRGGTLSLTKCSYKGIPLGTIEGRVSSPVQLKYLGSATSRKKVKLGSPVLVTLKAKVKEQDLALALESAKVASSLRALRLELPGLGQQQLEVLCPKIDLDKGLIVINGVLVTKGANIDTGVPMTISGNLKLKGDETIVLENTVVNSKTIVDPEHFALFLEDLLNPIISLNRFDRPNRALRLDALAISKGFVTAQGRVILAP